ncbi:hypothetical protein HF998_02430 [Cellulomonas hominis]|uniref:Uncharacterized protein n=1 Tax=Cellulomonas hominis TaxID=156981 RepID=A0A7W8SGH7_9CELL|nr:hypothetical protein [Cellulomonas hominis]MBB5474676.1 hypothetical protein [Cellulomonas hominis]NKY05844.1 hypothetical protein [Cellulomonas hominis]
MSARKPVRLDLTVREAEVVRDALVRYDIWVAAGFDATRADQRDSERAQRVLSRLAAEGVPGA